MKIFATIATLFVVGSMFGWVLEVFFRRFFSQKKWMNPGFLFGPYLPVYGFGVIGMYALSETFKAIPFPDNFPIWAIYIIEILAIGVTLITVEFIAGLIFIKGMGLKLWDYSDRKGNTMGIICPLFDLLWTAAGAIYFFFIHPALKTGIMWMSEQQHNIYYLFIGIVIGMMIVDFAYSAHLGLVMRNFAKTNKVVLSLKDTQLKIKENNEKFKKKFFMLVSKKDILELLKGSNEDKKEGQS